MPEFSVENTVLVCNINCCPRPPERIAFGADFTACMYEVSYSSAGLVSAGVPEYDLNQGNTN